MSVTPNIDTKALRELEAKATKGPWRWNVNLNSRHAYLESEGRGRGFEYVMDFARWGMGGAAPRFRSADDLMVRVDELTEVVPGREHHAKWYRTVKHPDAELIVALRNAAPALLDLADRAQELERDVARADAIALTASKDANELEAERDTLRDVGAALNREVEELRSERDALKAEMEQYKGFYESMLIRAREFQDERNALKAEVERLRSGMEVVARIKNELHAHNADIRAANGALQSKLSTSEREAERLREALGVMVDEFDHGIPDANCSCHICAPCDDCLHHAGPRDAVRIARAALRGEEAPRGK